MTNSHKDERELFGVLVTYRRPDSLETMLRTLAGQTRGIDHLYVVDNSPSVESRAIVAAHQGQGHRVTYIPSRENVGSAGGWSLGMGHILRDTRGEEVWIAALDDDDPPRSATDLAEMYAFACQMLRLDGMLAAVGIGGAGFDRNRGRMVRLQDDELEGPVPVTVLGTNLLPLYASEALRTIGLHNADLFFGFEELEFGLRMERLGFHAFCNGTMRLRRRALSRSSALRRRPRMLESRPGWRRYYSIRNLIWILRQNQATLAAIRITMVVAIGKSIVQIITMRPNAVHDGRLVLKACIDGWLGRLGRRVDPPSAYLPKSRFVSSVAPDASTRAASSVRSTSLPGAQWEQSDDD